MMLLALFALGAVFGSFLSVIIYRLPREQTISRGRSKCPHCKHVLSPPELIPIVSFIIQSGKCAHCQTRISPQYILLECLTGAAFVVAYLLAIHTVSSPPLLVWLTFLYFTAIFAVYIALFFIDLSFLLLPDLLVFIGIAVALVYQGLSMLVLSSQTDLAVLVRPLLASLGVGIAVAAFFLFLIIVTRGKGMGGGDVKLALLLGLVNGWPNTIVALFIAFLSGAVISVGLLALKKKKFTSVVPFGPFLIAGSFIALVFGNQLVDFYLNGVLG